ncbi:MAG: S-methyl-5-thioribose-1-phosphate isomerase [Planctomycetota bacterium]
MAVATIRWEGELAGHVRLLDQTLLPGEPRIVEVASVDAMVDAIRRLAVRGAPAIGVAAAYGVVLGVQEHAGADAIEVVARAREAAATLAKSRPTAVNLAWALDRLVARAEGDRRAGRSGGEIAAGLLAEADAVAREDAAQCRRMGEIGAVLLADGMNVLTHCNAGALATSGIGTALAPIYVAAEQGKRVHVWVDETRPLLQGARLTAWELRQAGIASTLIADAAAASVMGQGRVDAVLVGADRIARNGDVCNKIGTYGVAVLAARHEIPFYVVAPLSSFDPAAASGAEIPIEERAPEEITRGFGSRTAPEGVRVFNPAFDVTPAELVRAIVTEVGILSPPRREGIEDALRRGGRPL